MMCVARVCKFYKVMSLPSTNLVKDALQQRFASSKMCSYEAAIDALNSLQSNAQYLKNRQADAEHLTHDELKENCIGKMNSFLRRSNIKTDEIKSVIHIAGTKGKGTTCALCESILRQYGIKTGFFSSPHLINVTERIKINGTPIANDVFAHTFWEIYADLVKSRDGAMSMPIYFQMLTLIAFKLFAQEGVDVAIVEVGIGGEYDSTNVISRSDVVGITSLGIDHTAILGNTIEKIAWHKAGIMKTGSQAFTTPQCDSAMKVLQERSREIGCNLEVIEPIRNLQSAANVPLEIYQTNASLAMRITDYWMKMHNREVVPKLRDLGLKNCRWPGRFQVVATQNVIFYIDGAHTVESIKFCAKWFIETQSKLRRNALDNNKMASKSHKVLLFNSTGDRDVEMHLQILHACGFHKVYFVPNVCQTATSLDNVNHNFPESDQLIKCKANKRKWCEKFPHDAGKAHVMPSVNSALEHLTSTKVGVHHDVLITGSLHLVGCAIEMLGSVKITKVNAMLTN